MQTKYATGQRIMVPAVIRSAREESGKIIYEVDTERLWEGISEDDIILDERATARAALDASMRQFTEEVFQTLR